MAGAREAGNARTLRLCELSDVTNSRAARRRNRPNTQTLRPSQLSETFGRIRALFRRGYGGIFRPTAAKGRVNRSLQLRRSRVNGLGERERFVADLEGFERAQVSFHAAAHVAITGVMRNPAAEVNLHQRHAIFVVVQRSFHHTLDPKNQFLAAVDVLIRVNPNLHHGFSLIRCFYGQCRKEHAPPVSLVRLRNLRSTGLETQQWAGG